MLWATGAFVAFLALVILAANRGWAAGWFALVHALPGGDKLGHFVLMGILAFLLPHALLATGLPVGRKGVVFLLLTAALLIAAEEFSQIFLARRTFSSADLAADYAGFATGVLAARWCHHWSRVSRNPRRRRP